ncbi:MAG: hypothetical protein KIT33_09330 [Candidatus Kapabacteria bacterium]|nr:hypothetical protein [Ignavibacteriota bacterium]MCW5885158.1 hypothetical protein [Candidatus Kapabacteria bacterium]
MIRNGFFKLFIILHFLPIIFLPKDLISKNPENSEIKNLRDSINVYYYSFDKKKLSNLLEISDNLIKSDNSDYYSYYYNGIIRYCLGRVVYNESRDLAYDYFDSSLDRFEKAFANKETPVALAMISAAYGKKSALSPLKAIFLGQKAKNRIYDAYSSDSLNSKVLLVAATHLMHIPGFYGGDKVKARKILMKCLEINKKNMQTDSLELNWAGDAEIYAYLAQIDILEGKFDDARQNMKKALTIKPKYGFVMIDLENQIKKAEK